MKRSLIHIVYALVILFFAVLAYIKADEADKQATLALERTKLAERQMTLAEEEAARAVEQESRAELLQRELEACKSNQP